MIRLTSATEAACLPCFVLARLKPCPSVFPIICLFGEGFDGGLGESGYRGFGGFGLGWEAEFDEGLRCDGAYGDAQGGFREGYACGFAQGQEIAGGRGAGEGDGGWRFDLQIKEFLNEVNGGLRDRGAVGGSYRDLGAGCAEGFGKMFTGFFCSDE